MKAVIVDLLGGYAAALRDDGRVVKLPDLGYRLGQVIEIHERARSHWRRGFLSLAAAAALLLGIGGAAYAIPYGTVTLDADSSIQYTINLFDYVLDVQAENEEGEALLAELDLRDVRHHRVDSAISSTMEQIEQRGYLSDPEAAISVSADTRSERHTERLRQELERRVNENRPAPDRGQRPDSPDGSTGPSRPDATPDGGINARPNVEQAPVEHQNGEPQDFFGGDNPPDEPQGEQPPAELAEPPENAGGEGNLRAVQGGRAEDMQPGQQGGEHPPVSAERNEPLFPGSAEKPFSEIAPAVEGQPPEQGFGAPNGNVPER